MNLNCLLICGYFFFFRQLEAKLEQSSSELEHTKTVLRQKEEDAQENQQELKALKDAILEKEKRLEDQELEVVSLQRSVCDMEEQVFATQKVEDFQATIRQQEGELARLREVLRRTEKELDERVAHLEQRYLFSEEERSMCTRSHCNQTLWFKVNVIARFWVPGKTQKEGLRRVEELKVELASLQEAKRDEKKSQIQLNQKLTAATEELTKEKVTPIFIF